MGQHGSAGAGGAEPPLLFSATPHAELPAAGIAGLDCRKLPDSLFGHDSDRLAPLVEFHEVQPTLASLDFRDKRLFDTKAVSQLHLSQARTLAPGLQEP